MCGLILVAALLCPTASPQAAEPPAAHITDLAWMAGAWVGAAGEDATLEELWLPPADDSMAAVVRQTKAGETSMVELIVIEQAAATLIFRIQQWSKSYEPRMLGPQKMILAEISEHRVRFVGTNADSPLRSLVYSLTAPNNLNIRLELRASPRVHAFNLSRR